MIGYNSTSFLPIRRIFWFVSSQVDSRPEFPASDVISVIERGGPVILSNVTIVGDLDISAMDLPIVHSEATPGKVARLISARIDIRNCEFAGAVNLSGAVFQESIDFSWSVFCQEVRFKGASFLRDARMEKAQFKRYATFRDARFTGEARSPARSLERLPILEELCSAANPASPQPPSASFAPTLEGHHSIRMPTLPSHISPERLTSASAAFFRDRASGRRHSNRMPASKM